MYSLYLLMACVFTFGLYYYRRSNNEHLQGTKLVTDGEHANVVVGVCEQNFRGP